MRGALMELGPTYVKIGQVLSTRPDLIGLETSRELTKLQDRVDPLPFDAMKPVIETSLKKTIDDLFVSFDTTPVAGASLSQVYRARLHSGEDVAVKVQRPGIRQVIESDLRIMRGFAEWFAEHVEDIAWMDPVGIMHEFEQSLMRELDFAIELRNIERFQDHFRNSDVVFIPKVYRNRSTNTVLTMDWIEGVRVDDVEAYPELNSDPKIVAIRGCETLCEQVFEYRFFHADPHPGNVLLLGDNRLGFLDYGMVGHLEQIDVRAMTDLLWAVFEEDTEACIEALTAFTIPAEPHDRTTLEHEIGQYLAFEAQAMVGSGQVGKAIELIIALLQRHQLKLAPRFSLLLKSLATIESTGHLLDPNMDMVPVIRPYVERMIQRRYAPKTLAKDLQHDAVGLLRLGRGLPKGMAQLFRLVREGRLTVQLHHEKLDNLADVADRASNRITVALITAAIIVGSSMLIASGTGVRHLGTAGFTIAGILGISLVISILRSRNL